MAQRKKLTDTFITKSVKAPTKGRIEIMDTERPGLGLRVTDKGTMTFILLARFPGSANPTRRALGEYGVLSLSEAREKAEKWKRLLARGIDPREEEERVQREAREAAEAAQREKEAREKNSFLAVAEDFLADPKVKAKRQAKASERIVRTVLIPAWGKRPVADITPDDVEALVLKVQGKKGKRRTDGTAMARRTLTEIKRVLKWATRTRPRRLQVSPAEALKPKDLLGEIQIRQRILTDDEVVAFWRAADRMGYPYGRLYQVLLLTGARLNEIAAAEWSELHPDAVAAIVKANGEPVDWSQIADEAKVLTVPEQRFKTGSPHMIPLTEPALRIIEQLPRFGTEKFLFTTSGRVPVRAGSKMKAKLDARMMRTLKAMARRRGADPKATTLPPFVIHDTRRTVRTNLSRLRVRTEIAELVIGHGKKGIQRVYDIHEHLPEMREALEAWANRLQSLTDPAPANVIAFPATETA